MADISIAEVDQAEAALADAKSTWYGSDKDPAHRDAFDAAKREVVRVRQAYRLQEEAAGRRGGPVGGDAMKEN